MHEVHHLIPTLVTALRPTQMTVGLAEVTAKRAEWAALKPKARERLLLAHWFPAVIGPGGEAFIVDHHHLGIALHQEKVERAWVMPLEDYSTMDGDLFWRLMEFNRWAHPYDSTGRRREFSDIPRSLDALEDDPYRSLAGFVRRAGGYAKDSAPYTEFLWADYFRRQPLFASLGVDHPKRLAPAVIEAAVALAHDPGARQLPGWSGATPAPVGSSPIFAVPRPADVQAMGARPADARTADVPPAVDVVRSEDAPKKSKRDKARATSKKRP